MRKFTLFIAFIAITSFVFGQRMNQQTFSKEKAKFRTNPDKGRVEKKIHNNVGSDVKPNTVIWSDNFSTPANWTMGHASGTTADWIIINSGIPGAQGSDEFYLRVILGTIHVSSGNIAAVNGIANLVNAAGQGTVDIINANISVTLPSLVGSPNLTLKFNQRYEAFNSDTIFVEFSTDGGSTWPYKVDIRGALNVNTFGPDSIAIIVSNYIGNQANAKMRFRFETTDTDPQYGSGYGWEIDNVKLEQPNVNNIEITEIIPSFDYYGGTYTYYPATSPTMIYNMAVIKNIGSASQTNTALTVTINDPNGTYTQSSASGHTINSGAVNDTLWVGVDPANGYQFSNQFFLNCSNFTSPITATGYISHDYTINYSVTSDAITTPTSMMTASFPFHVGSTTTPYPGNPGLEYTYARSNQNPNNSDVSPSSWSGGGSDGDGIYVGVTLNEENGTTNVGGLGSQQPWQIFYGLDVFISNSSTFDAATNLGSTITGVIYKFDDQNMSWPTTPILSTNPTDIQASDTLTWKRLQFLTDGSSEYLTAGYYAAGIEITYNGFKCWIGCDNNTIQSYYSTKWNFPGSSTPGIRGISNFQESPMINLNVFSNTLAAKHTKDNNVVKIYPNPTNGIVSIAAPENSTIAVYNLLGVKVASIEKCNTFNTMDLSKLSDGSYIVKVVNGNNVTTKKLNLIK